MHRSLIPVAALLTLAACARTTASLLDTSKTLAPTCERAVTFYATPGDAPRPYVEVALIQSTANAVLTSKDAMRAIMARKAASVGATGIILGGITDPGTVSKVLGSTLGTGSARSGVALAIFSGADSAKAAASCAE